MAKAKFPRGVGFFVRVEDIIGIVKFFNIVHDAKNLFAVHLGQPRPTHQTIVMLAADRTSIFEHKLIDLFLTWNQLFALARIFDRFYRVDSSLTRSTEGAGLGLAISQRLAALMGGGIEVESRLGVGSTFRLRLELPVAEAEPEVRHAA